MKKISFIYLSSMIATQFLYANAKINKIQKSTQDTSTFEAPSKHENTSIAVDDENIHGYLMLLHVFDGEANGFDRNTGSGVGGGIKYSIKPMEDLSVGAEYYGSIDTGLTNMNKSIAQGMFMTRRRDVIDPGYVLGVHMKYERERYDLSISRSQFDSPLTKIPSNLVPNMYEYTRANIDLYDATISLALINKISYGSRSTADTGLIGEATGTAGKYMPALPHPRNPNVAFLAKGKYYSIKDTLPTGTSDSMGIVVLGYETKVNDINLKIWDFFIDDVANNLYISGDYKYLIAEGKTLSFSSHVWNQQIINDFYKSRFGGSMFGAKAALQWGSFTGKLAFETKDDGGLLNAWGANPGYTTSIFSRNSYRSNVDAYKATIAYKPNFIKGLVYRASYAGYSRSDMTTTRYVPIGVPGMLPTYDAHEIDFVAIYRPREDIRIRLFNAIRTSEYNQEDIGKQRTQNQTRLIVSFDF